MLCVYVLCGVWCLICGVCWLLCVWMFRVRVCGHACVLLYGVRCVVCVGGGVFVDVYCVLVGDCC